MAPNSNLGGPSEVSCRPDVAGYVFLAAAAKETTMNKPSGRGSAAIFLVASIGVLSGCAATKGTTDSPRSTSPLMEMNQAAWNKRDPAAIAALYHPEGVYAVPGAPPMKGPTAVAQYSGIIFTAVPDFKVTPVSIDVVNDRLTVTRWVM